MKVTYEAKFQSINYGKRCQLEMTFRKSWVLGLDWLFEMI